MQYIDFPSNSCIVTQLHFWVHIWDHHQAAKNKLLNKRKKQKQYKLRKCVCIFVFLKVSMWQPDDDPKCAPKHVTVLQYINSCVGRKVYIFVNNDRRDEVTGEWRRFHKEDLNDLYSSPNIVRVIKSRRMRWAGMWRIWVRRGGCIGSWWGNRREKDQWGDLGVDG